jgi:hypothetical protein
MFGNNNLDFAPHMNDRASDGMPPQPPVQPCGEWEQFITLLASGEDLPTAQHGEWIKHSAHCEACSNALALERGMLSLLSEHRGEPDATLLAGYRAALDDAIDREEEHGWLRRSLGFLLPASWLASGPAWGAAALLLAGFSSGLLLGPRVLHRPAAPENQTAATVATTVANDPAPVSANSLAALDLHTADVAGINVLPSGGDSDAPQVQLQMREQQPFTVEGTVDDDNVKDVLLNILGSGDRFCPDMRLDAVDLLRARNNDPDVRSALCHTVHNDKNAAVRLKALEALNGAEPQDTVQQTLLDALVDDQNPGVRVEAINALRDMVSKGQVSSSDKMLSVLHDCMHNDPNAYIRLQSAAAIRDLGPRGKF